MKWVIIILTILIFNIILILMKKRLKIAEIYVSVIFSLFVVLLTDIFASYRLKAWGFFNVEATEYSSLFIIFGIYPAAAAMIINWYPYKSVWWIKIGYLLGWTIFSIVYEWLALKVGILWHIHWNLFCSLLLYPFIYYMLIVHVRVYQWLTRKHVGPL